MSHRSQITARLHQIQSPVLAPARLFAVVPLLWAGCTEPTRSSERVLRGTDVTMAQGFARTEVTLGRDDVPIAVAVVLSEAALVGLPATTPMGGLEIVLPIPSGAAGIPFTHAAVNWQPSGHPPAGIYTPPHFDVHFYMISMAERDAMTPADPAFSTKANTQPSPDRVPPGYTGDPGAVPRMGTHWANKGSPEHQGHTFTHTMIYGFYGGSMVFIEPMVTKAFLESRPEVVVDFPTPSRYGKPGWYPSRYAVKHDAATKEYRIELRGFNAGQ